jgi:ABC-type bacteriocin/lantibiotic exporter with double-glycine peptidase domain
MSRTLQCALVVWLGLWGSAAYAEPPGAWLDVPFVPQERNGCGAASIAMVMHYWERQEGKEPGADADAVHIQRALYSLGARGIYASDLERYFEQHQFRAFAFTGEWSDLKQHVEKGRPLIVALKPGTGAPLHYVVVVGIEGERRLILVNDPARRKLLKQEWSDFEKEWKGAGNWALLAVPLTGAPSAP